MTESSCFDFKGKLPYWDKLAGSNDRVMVEDEGTEAALVGIGSVGKTVQFPLLSVHTYVGPMWPGLGVFLPSSENLLLPAAYDVVTNNLFSLPLSASSLRNVK